MSSESSPSAAAAPSSLRDAGGRERRGSVGARERTASVPKDLASADGNALQIMAEVLTDEANAPGQLSKLSQAPIMGDKLMKVVGDGGDDGGEGAISVRTQHGGLDRRALSVSPSPVLSLVSESSLCRRASALAWSHACCCSCVCVSTCLRTCLRHAPCALAHCPLPGTRRSACRSHRARALPRSVGADAQTLTRAPSPRIRRSTSCSSKLLM